MILVITMAVIYLGQLVIGIDSMNTLVSLTLAGIYFGVLAHIVRRNIRSFRRAGRRRPV